MSGQSSKSFLIVDPKTLMTDVQRKPVTEVKRILKCVSPVCEGELIASGSYQFVSNKSSPRGQGIAAYHHICDTCGYRVAIPRHKFPKFSYE